MKLYVGNLPWSATEDELRERFSEYGALTSVRIITDRETGKSKGFAFVEFDDAGAAQNALEDENERDLGGRTLRVSEAISKDRSRQGGSRDGNGHDRGGGGGHQDGNRKRRRDKGDGGRRDQRR